MHGASFALIVLAAVTTMADSAWTLTPQQEGRCRPNEHNPDGKPWRKSLGGSARARREPPALAPAGSASVTGMTEAEAGLRLSGQVTEDIVSPTVVAAAAEADQHESRMQAAMLNSLDQEEGEEDGSGTDGQEDHPLAEQQTAADDQGVVMKRVAREQNKAKFKDEEAVAARGPRTTHELGSVADEDILAPWMEFPTRADAELNLAELCEKHRKNYQL